MYKQLIENDTKGATNWVTNIKNLLKKCKMEKYWNDQSVPHIDSFALACTEYLQNEYIEEWKILIHKQPILRTYVLFKSDFNFENYLQINSMHIRTIIAQFRLSSHQLQIEKGRHHKPKPIPAENRFCLKCKNNDVEDEFHFLLQCPAYSDLRRELFNALKQHVPISGYCSQSLFSNIFQSSIPLLRHVGKYLLKAYELRK